MIKLSYKTLLSILLLLFTLHSSPLTSFAAFKDSGWGARPLGMGGAFCAVSDDTNGPLYNPAGIAQVKGIDSSFMYARPFEGLDQVELSLSYSALVFPVKKFRVGMQWARFENKDQYSEDTYSFTLSRYIFKNAAFGLNIKYLSHKYELDEYALTDEVFSDGSSKAAMAFDLGMLYHLRQPGSNLKNDLSFGFMLKNINQPDVGLKTKDIVPMEARVGCKYRMEGKIVFMPAADISYRMQEWGSDIDKTSYYAGVETLFCKEMFALRAGCNVTDITMGAGCYVSVGEMDFGFDYAFLMPLHLKDTIGTQRVSVLLRFFN